MPAIALPAAPVYRRHAERGRVVRPLTGFVAEPVPALETPLDRSEYEKLDRVEDRMWWFAAVHATCSGYIKKRAAMKSRGRCWMPGAAPAGCLPGSLRPTPISMQSALTPTTSPAAAPAPRAASRSAPGRSMPCPFRKRYSARSSASMCCVIAGLMRRPRWRNSTARLRNSVLILNLPAYEWMMSRHDEAVHNARATRGAASCGCWRQPVFDVVFTGIGISCCFDHDPDPQNWMPGHRGASSDVELYPAPIDALCRAATGLERILLRCGLRLPFGGSLIAVAAKRRTGKTDG